MSAAEAELMRPRSAHGVIVSIRDPGTAPVPLNPRWRAVLRLELSDIAWEEKRDLTPESLAEQAAALVAFVHAHRTAPLIAFHCHAGISRSRTAAAVVCKHYEWPYEWYPLHYALEVALQSAFAQLDLEEKRPTRPQDDVTKTMAKTHKPRSKPSKRAIRGGRKKRAGTKRTAKKHDVATPRQFGSLRGEVTVDEKFFEPIPAEELEGWGR